MNMVGEFSQLSVVKKHTETSMTSKNKKKDITASQWYFKGDKDTNTISDSEQVTTGYSFNANHSREWYAYDELSRVLKQNHCE